MIGKKIILIIFISFVAVGCGSKVRMYKLKVDVASKKENGQGWDIMGNAPDIQVYIDKYPLLLQKSCNNTYRCNLSFSSTKDKWYIEVYDKDLSNDDLIGKGDCDEGEECTLGLAKVFIED